MSPSPPPNLAIILIDPYNEFLHPKGKLYNSVASTLKSLDTITHMKTLVAFARKHKIPIYYGLHQQFKEGRNFRGWNHMTKQHVQTEQGHVFEEGSFGVEFFEGLEPDVAGNADVIVSRHWSSSSFQNTDLEFQLRQRDITKVAIAGLEANTCFEATSRYAFELGFHVTMLSDATASFNIQAKDTSEELIWPLFANEVVTVGGWIESVEKEHSLK